MSYCIRCGKENSDTAKFCTGCGISLIKNELENKVSVNIQPLKQKSKKKLYWVLSGLIVLIGIGIGAYFIFFNKMKTENKAVINIKTQGIGDPSNNNIKYFTEQEPTISSLENIQPAPATTNTESESVDADVSEDSGYLIGKTLLAKSDCITCHRINETLIGPKYIDIANKYAKSENGMIVTYLANKIIDGGKGNWGEVPMTPHPNLSLDDAESMVIYILDLKN